MLTPFLDGLFGLPMWFIGSLIGLIVNVVVLMILAYYARMEGLVLGWMALILCVMAFILFAWPLWPIAVVGVSVLWQMVAPPQRQLLPSGLDNAALIPIMLMTVSALIFLRIWPALVAPPLFLFVGFMLYSSSVGVKR